MYDFDEPRHLLFSTGRDIKGPDELYGYAAFQWTF